MAVSLLLGSVYNSRGLALNYIGEGRRKKEEGRGKKEEGRGKMR
jgi:hypothetical protein